MSKVDVVVVGAGLSGLTAATEIEKAGLSCVVLEARDRVGGKTWSVDPIGDGCRIDVGAAWINDTNQSQVFALAQELGLELVVQNVHGKIVQEDIDHGLSTFDYGGAPEFLSEPNGLSEMLRIRQLFEDTCQQIDIRDITKTDPALDQISLQEWVESHSQSTTALASVRVWTRAMLGLEPGQISALHFLNYCKSGGGLLQMRKDTKDGGQYLRFVQGTQSLSKGLAARLKPGTLKLSSPVSNITQHASSSDSSTTSSSSSTSSLTVTTDHSHSYTCKRVVITLPTPLLRTIKFSPPLPPAKLNLSQSTVQGYTNKVILLYRSAWWRRASLCGLLQSFTGPITVSRDSSTTTTTTDNSSPSPATDQFSLTCFLVGAPGLALAALSQPERFAAVQEHVARVFGPFCAAAGVSVEEPVAVAEYEWAKDRWSGGCPVPCFPPGGMMTADGGGEAELRRPFGGVHFAGTETSWEWKGYMDGAVRSGKRVVGELVQALKV